MRRRTTPRTTWRPHALDELLLAALRCAVEQRLDDVSEALLCALEAQARCTGEQACLDAAYVWAISAAARRHDRRQRGGRAAPEHARGRDDAELSVVPRHKAKP
jgi:hypothetical protein